MMIKYLETTKARQTREAKLENIQLVMERAWMTADEADRPVFLEARDNANKEWLYLRSNKEWLFNFDGGGWNSMMATDKQTAIRLAKIEYNNTNTKIDENTFRIRTEADYKQLLSLFY